jgi:hypothetical protein
MNDQENQQENQDSGQILAEFEQEAPTKSEDATVDPQVHGSEASAPEAQGSVEATPAEAAPEAQTETPQEAQAESAEPAAAESGQQENQDAGQQGNQDAGPQDFGQILAAFEGDAPKSEAPATGQKVKGKILSITEEWAFLDLGGKAEGRIAAADLKDAEGNLTVK